MTALIYALLDPDTKEIRYVGKTERGLRVRLGDHLKFAQSGHNTHKYNWIRELMSHGRIPEIVILEAVGDNQDWGDVEQKWIERGRSYGWPLTNQTEGGGGVRATDEVKEKMRAAWVERRKRGVSDETRKRMSEGKRGKRHSEAHRAANSACRMGHVTTEETKEKIRQSQLGSRSWAAKITEDDVREIRKRYAAAGITQAEIGQRYGLHSSTVSAIVRRKAWGHVK